MLLSPQGTQTVPVYIASAICKKPHATVTRGVFVCFQTDCLYGPFLKMAGVSRTPLSYLQYSSFRIKRKNLSLRTEVTDHNPKLELAQQS